MTGSELPDDVEPQRGKLYICGECGTVASTNSGKMIVGSAKETKDVDHPLHGKVDYETGVRMDPPCPCGNDLYNVDEYFVIHHEDQVGVCRSLVRSAEFIHG